MPETIRSLRRDLNEFGENLVLVGGKAAGDPQTLLYPGKAPRAAG